MGKLLKLAKQKRDETTQNMYLQKEEFSYYTQQFSKFGGLRPSSLRRMPPSLPALTRGSPGITKNEPIREQF